MTQQLPPKSSISQKNLDQQSRRLHPDTIEEVKQRADIVDVISEYVVLRKRGKDFVGLCPFHDEKTPSFSVSPSKQLYYCFGCGAAGNVFNFLMEIGRTRFVEVVLELAGRYGVVALDGNGAPYQGPLPPRRIMSVKAAAEPTFTPAPMPAGEIELAKLPAVPSDIPIRKDLGGGRYCIEYEYAPLLRVVRKEWSDPKKPKGRNKSTLPYTIDPETGEWSEEPTKGKQPWPTYRITEVLEHGVGKWACGFEGENKVEVARALGLVGWTIQGGSWSDEIIEATIVEMQRAGIAGIVYLADHDEAGSNKAQRVAAAAAKCGLPCIIPNPLDLWSAMPEKGDIVDWVATLRPQGMQDGDFVSRIEQTIADIVARCSAPVEENSSAAGTGTGSDGRREDGECRLGGSGNPPQPSENAYSLVKALVCSGLAPAQLLGQLVELSEATGYQLKGLQDLVREIEAETAIVSAASEDALETNKLLEYREQTLDLRHVFPEPLANYLLTKADSDRIDPVYIYQFLWSAIGLSLGAHIGIEGKEGTTDADSWVEFPIYYNMTVAPPSSGKSQTMRSVLGPIKRQQDREQALYKKAQKHLEKLKLEWNNFSAEDKERLKESELNPSVYERQMPQQPLVQLIEAGTPEGAFKRMSELPALSGCALAYDELIRIASLDQYKNQGGDTRQILMEAWSQPCSIKFVRSDDNNAPSLNKICINITGGIQPAKAKKLLSDPDDGDGLLSRFLIAQTKTPDNFAVWSSTKVEIDQALSGLYEFLGSLHFDLRKTIYGDDYLTSAVDGEQIILRFDAAAEERWHQWWSHVRTEMQRVEHENPALFGYLGKMLSQTLRIALGLHCIELMHEDKPDPLKVGQATLERAIYAAKFHIGQFRLLQANNDTNNLPGQLAKIHQYAQRKGTEVSATQVQNTVFKRLERKPTLAIIREYFKQLAEAGVAKLIGVGKDLKILVQKIVGSSVGIPTSSDQKSDWSQEPGSIAGQRPQGLEPKKSDFSDKRESAEATAVCEATGFLQSSNSVSSCGADCSLSQDCPNCRNSSVESTPNQGRELDSGSKHLSDFSSEDVGKSDSGEKSDSLNDPPGGSSGGGGQPTTPPLGDDSGVGEHLTASELADWHRRMETCQSRNDAEALWDSLEALPEGQREIVESSLCWDGFFSWWQEPEPDTTTEPSPKRAQEPESAPELPSPQPQLEELKALLLACSTLAQLDNLKRSLQGIGKAYRALSESEQNRIDAIASLAVPYKVYKYCGEARGQLRSGALVYIDPSATLRAASRFAPVWVLNGVARGWKAPVEVSLSLLREVVKAVSIELPETDWGQQMGLI